MRCNRQYMNETNLTSAEKAVLGDLGIAHRGIWVSREWLENNLCVPNGKLTQRRLDRVLKSLLEFGFIEKVATQDRGALYTLSETLSEYPFTLEDMRDSDVRGKIAVAQSPAAFICPSCHAECSICALLTVQPDPEVPINKRKRRGGHSTGNSERP